MKMVSMNLRHWSDCATNNAPAYEEGKCDCGAVKAGRRWYSSLYRCVYIKAVAIGIAFEFWLKKLFLAR